MTGFSLLRQSNLERELRQIRWRRPESGRGHFRIDMPLAMHRLTIGIGSSRGHGSACCGERLFVAAVAHPDLVEYGLAHERGERLASNIHHEQLLNRHSTAGIALLAPRHNVNANRRSICWLLSIQDLDQRG